jgi:hypothetical protein
MKGVFLKLEQGWVIEYIDNQLQRNFISLHPSDHITNKTQRVDGKEVEFDIVKETYDDGSERRYAKLINVDKLGNEDVPKLGYDVEKLAEEEYPIFDGDLLGIAHNQKQSRIDFIKGYNKAKETLYTEEQVRDAITLAILNYDSNKPLNKEFAKEIIQSLKQPKKD